MAPFLLRKKKGKYNVLFVISDDLTGNSIIPATRTKPARTPNIDALAAEGTRYTKTYCQFPVCGPSRASLMFGYYPHASRVFGYVSGRKQHGDRLTWTQHFQKNGYHTARVSKIFHMGVPGGIAAGTDGADDDRSWDERFNSKGPEVMAPGVGERLEGNPDQPDGNPGTRAYGNGNHLEYLKAEGDDLVHFRWQNGGESL